MRAGTLFFPLVTYDPPSDVIHARLGTGEEVRRERTEEGDWWGYDQEGRPTTLTVMEPRERLDRGGAVYVTLPSGERERLQGVEAAMRSVV
jgi:hypothetical protein